MSGKAKQAHRTKNNVRPSSSGRSAELLSSTVNPALVSVGPGKLLPTLFPSLGGPTIEQPLNNEFLLCFKKFHKKDPITKVKALNELIDLVTKNEQHEVVNALGSWAHYYPSLTVDIDRKVREATQTCHGVIVRKCGRQVALHIKRLLPAWLMAQHDEHPPVQRIARADLHRTFPESKLIEAIKYCKVDICSLYMDNLKGNAEYMLSGKKIDDDEEREAQIARVISSTLRAMELLISTLPEGQADWLWDTLLPLLCANSYWKLAGHVSPNVRASFYVVTGAVVDRFHSRLPLELARRCARTLVAHAERVPAVCVERWRALIKLVFNVQDSLELLDKKDLLMKRLWDVFENAAWGQARQLAGLLPNLLQIVPDEMHSEAFYNKYFTAVLTGLRQKSLLHDEIEREHWNGIIEDSFRYVTAEHQQAQYVVRLAARAHRAWLKMALTAPDFSGKSAFLESTATHMAGSVTRWVALAADGKRPAFDRIAGEFWLNITSSISDELEKLPVDGDDIMKLIDAHMQLTVALKRNIVTLGGTPGEEAAGRRCLRDLEEATEAVIGVVLDYTHKQRLVRNILPVAMPVLKEFQSQKLFQNLAQKFEFKTIFELYKNVARAWVVDDDQCCESAVELAFLLAECLEDEEQDALFKSFPLLSPEVVRWWLALVLAAPGRGRGRAAARWLRSGVAARVLEGLARGQDDAHNAALLLAALERRHDDDVVVSDEAITGVVGACSEMLNSMITRDATVTLPGEEAGRGEDAIATLEPRVQLAARVLHAVPAGRAACALPLLSSLFRLTLRIPRDSPLLAAEAWTDALGAWRGAARRMPREPRDAFVADAVRHLHWHLLHDVETLDIKRIDHVASLCPYFTAAGDEPAAAELAEHSRLVLDVRPAEPPPPPLEVFALQADVIWGDLNCPFESDNDWIAAVAAGAPELTERALVQHAYRVLFRASYVREVLPAAHCGALLRADYFRDQFCNMLHDCAVLNSIHEHYAFWNRYDLVCEIKEHMDKLVFDVVAQIPAAVQELLAVALEEQAATHGYYWSYARQQYKRAVSAVQELTDTRELLEETPEDADIKQESELGTAGGEPEPPDAVAVPDEPSPDGQQSPASSSFEMLDAYESIDADDLDDVSDLDASNDIFVDAMNEMDYATAVKVTVDRAPSDVGPPCGCHQLHSSAEEVFFPLLIDRLSAEPGERLPASPLARAAPPDARLASRCEKAALYVDLLGKMMLANGYFHDAQMKAKEMKRRKSVAKAKFDRLQDAILADVEFKGQPKIFHKWCDEPAAYQQLGADVDEGALYTAKDFAMLRSYYCVYASAAPHVDQLLSDVASDDVECNLDAVIDGYYRHNDTLLFERSLQDASWLQLSGTAAVLDLLCELVPSRGWDAPALHWDFTNIALCSMINTLALSSHMWTGDTVRMALVARPALQLYVRVRRFISCVRYRCMRRQPSMHVAALPREWADIFAPDVTTNMSLLICHVLEGRSRDVSSAQAAALRALTGASAALEADAGRAQLPRLVHAAAGALADACHHGFKYLAYYTLRALAPALVDVDMARMEVDQADAELTLSLYHEHVERLQELVDAVLSAYTIGDDICEVLPHTDSYSLVLGYLLLCVAIHHQCELATGDLAILYGNFFTEQQYGESMLPAALRLLPPAVVHYMAARLHKLPRRFLPWFIRLQDFDINEACTSEMVSRLACGVVLRVLDGPGGAAVRGWWVVRRTRDAAAILRLVQRAVSPALVNHQLAQLRLRVRDLGAHARLSICWSARSAAVQLRDLDPVPMMRVTLGSAHPLQAPRVHTTHTRANSQWVALFLGHQNGRVIDAMKIWVKTMRLAAAAAGRAAAAEAAAAAGQGGVPRARHCYVCYCNSHPVDGGGPSVLCYQCGNNYHPTCLRRWFKTSHRSKCPLCRTSF